ncbi:MAG TPA: DUF350 domain-containing protein [Verrucomicrobiae bacterium]|nr:DUF350 domain-containing protein [Verrucomicrobiae bacterium]
MPDSNCESRWPRAQNRCRQKSIGHALLNSVVFAAAGMALVFAAIKVFDLATPRIDIQKELLNHNIAVA